MNGTSTITTILFLITLTAPIWLPIALIIKIRNKIKKRKDEKRKLELLEEINKKLNNDEQ